MFKSLFFLLLGMLFFQNVKAQQDTLLYFFRNTGEIVADRTSADYFLIVTPPDQEDPNLFLIKGYYKDGSIRLIAKSTINTLPFNFQGPSIWYFVNGKKRVIRNYEMELLWET